MCVCHCGDTHRQEGAYAKTILPWIRDISANAYMLIHMGVDRKTQFYRLVSTSSKCLKQDVIDEASDHLCCLGKKKKKSKSKKTKKKKPKSKNNEKNVPDDSSKKRDQIRCLVV